MAAGTAGTTVKPVIKLGGPRKGIIRLTTKYIHMMYRYKIFYHKTYYTL